jgi:long-chain acyl-CoA synthetase
MRSTSKSVAALLHRQSQAAGPAAICEVGREWGYPELAASADEVAECLRALGVVPGERVALMLPNSGAFVAAFFGIVRAGAVVAPFNVRYRDQELLYYLADTSAAVLLVSDELVGLALDALAGAPQCPSVVAVSADGTCRTHERRSSGASPLSGEGRHAPLLHQYTSGSTGRPKRIIRTDGMLLDELTSLAAAFGLTAADRFLGAAPFSHVNGMVRTMLASMFVGARLYPVAEFRRRPVLDLITHEAITCFGGVPYMFAILAETPVRGRVDLGSIRVAFSSSAPLLPADNCRFAERYGLFVRQLYGSTETGTISVNLDVDPSIHLGSVGTPLEGVRLEILGEGGIALQPGEEGEVAIASPTAIRAYDGNPQANAASFRDDLYLSGDLGRLDAEGRLTLTGRKKFLINRAGYKVNPVEVEQALLSHPKVREVVVLGAPSRFGDEVIRCVAVVTEACATEELVEHCRPLIADFKIPSRIEFRDELPKSATGKILRSEL